MAYGTVLQEQRKTLHEKTAQAIEALRHSNLEDHYGELAHHYTKGGNTEKAIEYLHLAGQQAAQRSAYSEAIGHLSRRSNYSTPWMTPRHVPNRNSPCKCCWARHKWSPKVWSTGRPGWPIPEPTSYVASSETDLRSSMFCWGYGRFTSPGNRS